MRCKNTFYWLLLLQTHKHKDVEGNFFNYLVWRFKRVCEYGWQHLPESHQSNAWMQRPYGTQQLSSIISGAHLWHLHFHYGHVFRVIGGEHNAICCIFTQPWCQDVRRKKKTFGARFVFPFCLFKPKIWTWLRKSIKREMFPPQL